MTSGSPMTVKIISESEQRPPGIENIMILSTA